MRWTGEGEDMVGERKEKVGQEGGRKEEGGHT